MKFFSWLIKEPFFYTIPITLLIFGYEIILTDLTIMKQSILDGLFSISTTLSGAFLVSLCLCSFTYLFNEQILKRIIKNPIPKTERLN